MSITKQHFLNKAKGRFEWVEVEGFGKIGLRSIPQITSARRDCQARDLETGLFTEEGFAAAPIYQIIDQVMSNEKTPLFAEEDFESLAELDPVALNPIFEAIAKFNGNESKNGSAG